MVRLLVAIYSLMVAVATGIVFVARWLKSMPLPPWWIAVLGGVSGLLGLDILRRIIRLRSGPGIAKFPRAEGEHDPQDPDHEHGGEG